MLMGVRRLEAWGFDRGQIPLGGYIYEACAGQDPIYRLGMLGYFETKNIGRKRERAEAFEAMGDSTSERDMEFDWADETLHAEYGRRWLRRLLEVRGEDPEVDGRPCSSAARSSFRSGSRARRRRISSGSGAAPTRSSPRPSSLPRPERKPPPAGHVSLFDPGVQGVRIRRPLSGGLV